MKITEFLEKIHLFCVEKRRDNFFDKMIALTGVLLLHIIIKESNKSNDLGILGITPFLSIIFLILVINQYFFRSIKPKLKETLEYTLFIIFPIAIYLYHRLQSMK